MMTTVREQSGIFLTQLKARRRNPPKKATVKAYGSYLENWIVPFFGDRNLSEIENGAMRQFVTHLVNKKLQPATVGAVVTACKALIRSEIDGNGNILNPREWNGEFLDMPAVHVEDQRAPTIGHKALSWAIRQAQGQFQAFYALQAGSGLRMSEMLSLRMGPDDGISSIWDPEAAIIHIRCAMYDRQEQSTKSVAGVRQVDIWSGLNSWLAENLKRDPGQYLFQTRNGNLLHTKTLYQHLETVKIPGTHSLRRFRASYLASEGCTEDLIKYWLGHAGKSITDRYLKPQKFVEHRRGWAERAKIGFELPEERIGNYIDNSRK
jgi:integrase